VELWDAAWSQLLQMHDRHSGLYPVGEVQLL
jgi:hypothetical protein